MNPTVVRLTARSLLGRRRALILLALPAVLLVLAGAARAFLGARDDVAVGLLGGFAMSTLLPLFALIVGTGAIGPEIDDGSIVYLLAKPLSRASIVHSKLAVAVTSVALLAAAPVLVAGVLVTGEAGRLALGYALGALIAGATYCALFLMLAVLSRNAVVIGLLYALVWEGLVGQFVPGAQAISVQQWSLAVVRAIVGPRAQQLGVTSAVGVGVGAVLLAVVAVASTWFAGRRLRALRLSGDE